MPDPLRTVRIRAAQKKGQAHAPASAHTKCEVQFCSSSVKRVRREWRRPCLIDELCSESSVSSSTSDATTARWFEAFQRHVAVTADLSEVETSEFERRDPDVGVSTRRAKEKVTAVTVLGVEAWAVAVSPGSQGTSAMLEAVLLAARTSESEVE